MIILYIVIAAVVGGVILLRIVLVKRGGHSFPWLQFYIRGKEARFSFGEISNLQRLIMTTKLRDPLSVYWSQKAIMSCLTHVDSHYRSEGRLENMQEVRFMRKLYDLLNRVKRSSQQKKRGLQNTRELDAGMPLDLLYGNKRYKSQIIEIQSRYIAIAHPQFQNPTEQVRFVPGETIAVNLWRKGDSGYNFSTRILPGNEENTGILHIQHGRKMNRTQTRNLVRKHINKPGSLTIITNAKNALDDKDDEGPVLRCQVLDISEGGMSVLIAGQVTNQFGFKVHVRVGAISVVMTTRLVGSEYHKTQNVSLMRLKALNKNLIMLNRISAIVYEIGVDHEEIEKEETQ